MQRIAARLKFSTEAAHEKTSFKRLSKRKPTLKMIKPLADAPPGGGATDLKARSNRLRCAPCSI